MNIVIVGHVCIDQNTSESSSYTSAGSPAMFMNKIFQFLPDAKVNIITSYGPDFSEYIEGVSIWPKKPNLKKTLIYENISFTNGKRMQKAHNYKGALLPIITEEAGSIIHSADVIIIAPLLPNILPAYIQSTLNYASKDSIVLLLPQGFYRQINENDDVLTREFQESTEILPHVNVVTVSNEDNPHMLEIARSWVKKYNLKVVMTQGKDGALIIDKNKEQLIPTEPVNPEDIIDSVGSGDIFSTALIYQYKRTGDMEESTIFANAIARQCLFYTPDNIRIDLKGLL